jgi:hypothetical protein
MDTNINNYNVSEILNLLKINEEDCNLENVYYTVMDFLKKINNTEGLSNKKNILLFIKQCFYKICNVYNFYPNEIMGQNIDTEIALKDGIRQTRYNTGDINAAYDIAYDNAHDKDHNEVPDNNITHDIPYIGSLPAKIPEIVSIGANTDKYTRGLVNPLKRETIKNILTIHSKFRNDLSQSTTDFSIILNEPFNNVVSLKLASMELMNSYYAISDYLKTNKFTVETYKLDNITNSVSDFYSREIELSEGSYTMDTMYPVINAIFNADPSLNMLFAQYNSMKGKLYFKINDAPLIPPPAGKRYAFNLIFTISDDITRPLFLNLGCIFGFCKHKYTFLNDYVLVATSTKEIGFNPEAPFDCTGTKFFLLEVIDYNNNAPAVLKYNIQDRYTFNIKDILAKVPNVSTTYSIVFEDSSDRIFKARKYFGPVKLTKLKIRLLDENGRIINLNNSNVAISFEVESLDIPYKNMVK